MYLLTYPGGGTKTEYSSDLSLSFLVYSESSEANSPIIIPIIIIPSTKTNVADKTSIGFVGIISAPTIVRIA